MCTLAKRLLLSTILALSVLRCGAAPKGVDLTLPTVTTTTQTNDASTTPTSVPAITSNPAPSPTPSASPLSLITPSGHYNYLYQYSLCGTVKSHPYAEFYNLSIDDLRNNEVSPSVFALSVNDSVPLCGTSGQWPTFDYRITFTATTFTRKLTQTYTYPTALSCGGGILDYTTGPPETFNYLLTSTNLTIILNDNCDGNGTHTHEIYRSHR